MHIQRYDPVLYDAEYYYCIIFNHIKNPDLEKNILNEVISDNEISMYSENLSLKKPIEHNYRGFRGHHITTNA